MHKFGEEIYVNPFGRNGKAELLRAKRQKSGSASLDIYGKRAFRNCSRKARKPLIFLAKTAGHLFRQGKMVGVTGIEPAASWSQTRRATSCATPRYCILAWLVLRFCVLWRCINKMRPQAALRCARKMRLHIKEKRYTLCQSGLSAPKRLAR